MVLESFCLGLETCPIGVVGLESDDCTGGDLPLYLLIILAPPVALK